jgi:hypothetical protein
MWPFPGVFPANRIRGSLLLGPGSLVKAPGGFVGLDNYAGNPFFIDPVNGNDLWDGTLPKRYGTTLEGPKKTFGATLLVAAGGDVIICAQGDVPEDGLVITQQKLKLLGWSNSGLTRGSPMFIGLAAVILTVKAHDVEISGFGFYQTFADTCISIAENPDHYWRTYIHDNGFSGDGTGTWGIKAGAVAAEAPYTVVERCRFYNLVTGGVRLNSSAMVVQDCDFQLPDNAIGIEDVPNSTSRPDRYILRNKFKALGAGCVGVKVTNTPSPGELMIDDNHFVGFASDAACCDVAGTAKTGLMGLNYNGSAVITAP